MLSGNWKDIKSETCSLESGRSYSQKNALWKVEGHIDLDMLSGKWMIV